MITLPDQFERLAALRNTRKIIRAKLWYGTGVGEYIGVSTRHYDSALEGQFWGIVTSYRSGGFKWEISTTGKVARTQATLTIKNRALPDGSELIDTILTTKKITGFTSEVFLGYEESGNSFFRIGKGIVDKITFKNGLITITIEQGTIDAVPAAGRLIDPDKGEIGGASFSGIPEEGGGLRFPETFGDCPYGQVSLYYEDDDDYKLAIIEGDDPAGLFSHTSQEDVERIWRPNLGGGSAVAYRIYFVDNGFLVPLDEISWIDATSPATFQVGTTTIDSKGLIRLILLKPAGTIPSDVLKLDGRIFLPVTMKFWAEPGVATPFEYCGNVDTTNSDPIADFALILNAERTSTPADYFEFCSQNAAWVANARGRVVTPLDWNLRVDRRGSPRLYRPFHFIDNPDLRPIILGWADNTQDGMYCSVYYSFPSLPNPGFDNTRYLGDFGFTGDYDNWLFIFGSGTVSGYTRVPFDGGASDADEFIPYTSYGSGAVTSGNKLTRIDRETMMRPLDSGGMGLAHWLGINTTQVSTSGSCDVKGAFWAVVGDVEVNFRSGLAVPRIGMQVQTSDMLTVATTSLYLLGYVFQYMEYLLRQKLSADDDDFGGSSGPWSDLETDFPTDCPAGGRRYSGFSINDNTTVPELFDSLVQNEPFTIFKDEDGVYNFPYVPTEDDPSTVGTIDFNDCDGGFEIELTSASELCAEILELKTDYIPQLEKYAQNFHWKLDPDDYDYDFWDSRNSADANGFIIKKIEKPYTSACRPNRTRLGTSPNYTYYSGLKTNPNNTDSPDTAAGAEFWREMPEYEGSTGSWDDLPTSNWSTGFSVEGEDYEQYLIAKYWLNMWANRHRIIKIKTSDLTYCKFSIGDIIEVANCPHTLLGVTVKGFAGDTSTTYQTVNGQRVYYKFQITEIRKSADEVQITAMQLHKLDAYEVIRLN